MFGDGDENTTQGLGQLAGEARRLRKTPASRQPQHARARSEQQIVEALVAARAAGTSWQKIGAILGTSAQAAQQRYGAVIEPA